MMLLLVLSLLFMWPGYGLECPAGFAEYSADDYIISDTDSCPSGFVAVDMADCAAQSDSDFCAVFCDVGYAINASGTCAQLCGTRTMDFQDNTSVTLWAARGTTPALRVGIGDGACYIHMVSGTGPLATTYGGASYHAAN